MKQQFSRSKRLKNSIALMLGMLGLFGTLASTNSMAQSPPTYSQLQEIAAKNQASGAQLYLKNVQFNYLDNLGFYVPELKGMMIPTQAGIPVTFDDPELVMIKINSGSVIVKPDALTTFFQRNVLAFPDAPMDEIAITTSDDKIVVDGKVKLMGVWLPMHMESSIALKDGQVLVLTPTALRVAGIPSKSLMDMVGLKMGTLVKLDSKGTTLIGNEIEMKLFELFPPPYFIGNATGAHITKQGLQLDFLGEPTQKFNLPANPPNSFIWLDQANLKFFNMVSLGNSLLMRRQEDSRPLVFSLYNYRKQIANGGEIRMKSKGSLEVTLP